MSHKIIYNCDFCGREIDYRRRYLVTLPHLRDDEGGRDEDVCGECARRIEAAIDALREDIRAEEAEE